METPSTPRSIDLRLREGLERIATAIGSDDWQGARAAGINPTQYDVLKSLQGRLAGLTVKDIAFQLGVSQPTATDSIAAIERKGLVAKRPAPDDRRSVRVVLTDAGIEALRLGQNTPSTASRAIAALDDGEQTQLLLTLVAMIRQLQETGAIPIQRMCISCRYFGPFAHADAAKPHHCHFVDAAFGQDDLRIDCREHETADPSLRAATWSAFRQDQPQTPPGQ